MFLASDDESTDIALCAQLLVFVGYIHLEDIKEEFLFCCKVETTPRRVDIVKKITFLI